jgi:hypothetical protein
MPVSKNVDTILSSLQKYGVNPETIANMRRDLDGNKAADNYLNEGILRRNQFTAFVTQSEKEKRELQDKVKELATLHDAANSTSIDQNLVKSLTEKIAAIEDYLIDEGYDEDEVRGISFKEKTALTESLRTENLQAQKTIDKTVENKEEENDMPNYVDEDTFKRNLQSSVADMTLNQMQIQSEIAREVRKYERLYGREVDDSLVDNFTGIVVQSILNGENKTVPQIAESHFKISERQEQNRNAEFEQKVEAARREERAKVLKETGVPARNSSRNGGSAIFRRQKYETSPNQNSQTTQTSQQVEDNKPNLQTSQDAPAGMVKLANGKIVPLNKEGIPEFFRGRRSQEERVESASNFYNEVVEKVGEEGERMGFME